MVQSAVRLKTASFAQLAGMVKCLQLVSEIVYMALARHVVGTFAVTTRFDCNPDPRETLKAAFGSGLNSIGWVHRLVLLELIYLIRGT